MTTIEYLFSIFHTKKALPKDTICMKGQNLFSYLTFCWVKHIVRGVVFYKHKFLVQSSVCF